MESEKWFMDRVEAMLDRGFAMGELVDLLSQVCAASAGLTHGTCA